MPGYASPMGVENILIVADDSIPGAANLVSGANEEGYHLRNVNYGRDWEAGVVADIAAVGEGADCGQCGGRLQVSRGVEVGNIFQLGTRYTEAMHCVFLDAEGKPRPVIMGSYGIGVGRLLACVAQEHHDDNGLALPVSIAPYQVHLVSLAKTPGAVREASEALYDGLREAGVEVLYDDRGENPGVKFNDADLIGLPIRITIGDRSLKKGQAEIKLRRQEKAAEVPVESAVEHVIERARELRAELEARVVEVPYTD